MGRSRNLAMIFGGAGLLLALLAALIFRPAGATAQAQPQNSGTYVGVATCSGSTCHGRSEPTGKIVRQDELMIWQDDSTPAGAHSRAWSVLQNPRSRMIAQNLGIGEATRAPMCLGRAASAIRRLR